MYDNAQQETLKKDDAPNTAHLTFFVWDLLALLQKPLRCLTEEELLTIENRTFQKTICEEWPSNDEGDTLDFYTGFDANGTTPRYLLRHFNREWLGGWSHIDTTKWYEISKQEYETLCNFIEQ